MAKPQDRALALSLTICVVFLSAFGVYVWNATVLPKDANLPVTPVSKPAKAADPRLTASLHVDRAALAGVRARGKGEVVTAEFRMTNDAPERVTLLDGILPSMLLEVRLFHLGPDGKQAPRPLPVTGPAAGAPAGLPRHALVDLMPGRTFILPVRLAPPYDLTAPGRYRLEVRYQPAAYVNALSLDVSESGVLLAPVTPPPLEFEVPEGSSGDRMDVHAVPETPPASAPGPKER
jgi:hypothetical protein